VFRDIRESDKIIGGVEQTCSTVWLVKRYLHNLTSSSYWD
jgi:hypothetical protein